MVESEITEKTPFLMLLPVVVDSPAMIMRGATTPGNRLISEQLLSSCMWRPITKHGTVKAEKAGEDRKKCQSHARTCSTFSKTELPRDSAALRAKPCVITGPVRKLIYNLCIVARSQYQRRTQNSPTVGVHFFDRILSEVCLHGVTKTMTNLIT